MDLASWLVDNILPEKCLGERARNQGDVVLQDNGSVSVQIKNLPPSVIIVPEKIKKEEWKILRDRYNVWNTRCDYILVGNCPKYGTFVFFVELKESMLDYEDRAYERSQSEKAYVQLWWTKPMFEYLLSAFYADNYPIVEEEDLAIRYFILGAEYIGTLGGRINKQGTQGRLFHAEEYRSITVNMIETRGVRFPVKFADMILKSK